MKKLLIPLFLAAIPSALLAQAPPQAKPTPPLPPLLNRAPDLFRWVITIKAGAAAASGTDADDPDDSSADSGQDQSGGAAQGQQGQAKPAAVPPSAITMITKDKDIIVEDLSTELGGKMELWHLPGGGVAASANGGPWNLVPALTPSFQVPDYSRQDFSGLDWISDENFVGVQTVMGFDCLVFKGKVMTSNSEKAGPGETDVAPSGGRPEPVTAYIDNKSRLPIVVVYKVRGRKETLARIYQYTQPPAAPVVPPGVQNLMKSNQDYKKGTAVAGAPI